jgi:hypothetical protein
MMHLVVEKHQLDIAGLKSQFDSISSNFDKARVLSSETRKIYNEKSIKELES